jgi:hypothetical protein
MESSVQYTINKIICFVQFLTEDEMSLLRDGFCQITELSIAA